MKCGIKLKNKGCTYLNALQGIGHKILVSKLARTGKALGFLPWKTLWNYHFIKVFCLYIGKPDEVVQPELRLSFKPFCQQFAKQSCTNFFPDWFSLSLCSEQFKPHTHINPGKA